MVVGVPKEIKEGENRVALTAAGVRTLREDGHTVLVQTGAGEGSGVADEDYVNAGATMVKEPSEIFERADMIVKVKEPLPSEYPLLRKDQVLFTYLHLASSWELTEALLKVGLTAVGYETIQLPDGSLPLLTPMSEVAGKMATQVGATALQKHNGGRGVLLGGVPGVPPADVVIIGCGVVGFNAAKVAVGMGAQVVMLDIDHDRLRYLSDVMHGAVITAYSNPATIEQAVAYADLLIGAVLIAGARAPKLVTESMVKKMKRAAVIVDVAIDQGGCVETTHPTSYSDPTYELHGVLHYAVPNMPAAVPRTSTFALTNATLRYVRQLAALGIEKAAEDDPAIKRGINVMHGEIVHPAVKAAFA